MQFFPEISETEEIIHYVSFHFSTHSLDQAQADVLLVVLAKAEAGNQREGEEVEAAEHEDADEAVQVLLSRVPAFLRGLEEVRIH